MAEPTRRKKWSEVKAPLDALDRKGLVSLLGDLYDANEAIAASFTRASLPTVAPSRSTGAWSSDAIYPNPFSTRRVSVRDAAAAIVEYRRSTGDASGTVDLMLTFVEAGTEQAADLGYGDEAYFDALLIRLDAVAKEVDTLPAEVRANVRARLGRIQVRAQNVGWGFGDAVDELLHALDARAAGARSGKVARR